MATVQERHVDRVITTVVTAAAFVRDSSATDIMTARMELMNKTVNELLPFSGFTSNMLLILRVIHYNSGLDWPPFCCKLTDNI